MLDRMLVYDCSDDFQLVRLTLRVSLLRPPSAPKGLTVGLRHETHRLALRQLQRRATHISMLSTRLQQKQCEMNKATAHTATHHF